MTYQFRFDVLFFVSIGSAERVSCGRGLTRGFYRKWRALQGASPWCCREGSLDTPPERLLQEIWYHQRFPQAEVRTVNGERLRLLHPGFWNRESGPDFRNGVIQFAGAPPSSGDIEIDIDTQAWYAHQHEGNPEFANVILHVVWKPPPHAPASRPTLVLSECLREPLQSLQQELAAENLPGLPETVHGQCSAPLKELEDSACRGLMEQAAAVRFELKAARFRGRARYVGWERALWEGLFGALGYKHNVWPMRRLAECLEGPDAPEPGSGGSVLAWQARLLGLGGLIPYALPRRSAEAGRYVRKIWETWWRERASFSERILPRRLWRFSAVRPANRPERRLALAAHWLAQADLPKRLEAWGLKPIRKQDLVPSLLELLHADDAFWEHHWSLHSATQRTAHPLLGAQRTTDIAVNVLLPWLWSRAESGGNASVQEAIMARYFAWPAGESNALLRFVCQRLMPGGLRKLPPTAAMQQGLLQIHRDFCENSNALCESCCFPELTREFKEMKPQ